ncbi:division plane positioning ATPase MipZ [Rhodopirellula sp. MGV]|uniref:division plane positioning ATPase MipZ n=1 Tax=Rhodopirellula sp. MGV TaxID=2023130 RepID=UPI000B9620EB|nr:division plane positioning ATPase MipZ [Rhodopirellula sp. MGV]OYP30321.1 hypothetical protein CGZ80_22805 [Rhodopirellula sp. MGV]PNY34677.1 hypothetical protein C2E31_22150 [Rhodopirellula baltica]
MSIKQSFIGAYARQRPSQETTGTPQRNVAPTEDPTTSQWVEGPDDQVLRIDRPVQPQTPEQQATPDQAIEQSPVSPLLETTAHVVTAHTLEASFQASTLDVNSLLIDTLQFGAEVHAEAIASPESLQEPASTVEAAHQPNDITAEPHTSEPQSQPTSPPPTSPRASRWRGAAWEVDSFSIPRHVADAFFEEGFFRSIADHLGRSVRSGLRSVLVTSLNDGEGRSTTTLGTAIAAAATGLSVAIVDVDVDVPGQAEQLCLEIESDWVTAIRQGQTLESVAIASIEDGVTLLPLLGSDEASLPATSMDLDRLIDQIHGCFDLVIFDGPIASSWATPRIASSVDSCLIVRDARITHHDAITRAAEILKRQGVQGIGIVDNFA